MKATRTTLVLTVFIAFMGCKNLHPQLEQGTSSSNEPEAWKREFYEAVDNESLSTVNRILEEHKKEELQAVLNGSFQSTALNRKAYPLHVAAGSGYYQLVSLLLDNGADPRVKTENSKFTPLHLAVRSKKFDVVDLLLTKEAKGVVCIDHDAKTEPEPKVPKNVPTNVNAQDVNDFTPLHWAAKEGYEEIAKLLLSNPRTNRTIRDAHDRTAEQLAEVCGNPHIVKLFEAPGWRRLCIEGAKECDKHCDGCLDCSCFGCKLNCGCFKAPCSFVCKTLCCAWPCCCPLPTEETAAPAPSSSSATAAPNPTQQPPLPGNAPMQRW